MELDMRRLFWSCAFFHTDDGDSSCLSARFVHLDLGHLFHQTDIDILLATEVREFGNTQNKGIGHTQFGHDVIQVEFRHRLKARQLHIHHGLIHPFVLLPFLCRHTLQHLVDRLALMRQQDGHLIRSVAVWQRQYLTIRIIHIGQVILQMHHRHLLLSKLFRLRLSLVELQCPSTLEIQGVEQIAHRIGIELILFENLGDHPFGMVVCPLVDDIQRLSVTEVSTLWYCIIVLVCLLDERILQLIAFRRVEEDGIGNHHLGELIQYRCLREHLPTEVVDGVSPRIAKAQYGIDLLQCLASSAVVKHSQSIGDAQRRKNHILILAGFTEEVEGKIIIANHQHLLIGSQ